MSANKQSSQTKAHRRREMNLRAARCRQVAISRGYRHATPLLDTLAEFGAISDKLPYASQKTLGAHAGVTDRTIRNWLVILETLDLVIVIRSPAKPTGTAGEWTRQTNRYVLCDRVARRQPPSSPVRRRHRTAETRACSPGGNELPVTSLGLNPDGAERSDLSHQSLVVTEFIEENVSSTAPPPALDGNHVAVTTKPDPKTVLQGLSVARAALERARTS